MPDRILEKHPERCFRIPMSGPVRSLNLATAAGIVLYEALRQNAAVRPCDCRRLGILLALYTAGGEPSA